MSEGLIIFIVILGIILFILISIVAWWIKTSNWFRQTKVKIDESKSSIDIMLTKRYDQLTKSVATVKGYSKHESETLEKIVGLRSGKPISEMNMTEKGEFANQLSELSHAINVTVERYPDLKADKGFLRLQDDIADVEDNLQASRRIYNSNVSTFNQTLVSFPSSIVGNSLHLSKELFFEAEAHKREDVKIEF